MSLQEAAQQALEALEGFLRFAAIHSDGPDASDKYLAEDYAEEAFLKAAKVLPDLRAALEQPEQEPVAWMRWDDDENYYDIRRAPPPQEAIDYLAKWNRPAWHPLYTHPPRREWVSLTDEDIALIDWESMKTKRDAARAIEQALRSKNNG